MMELLKQIWPHLVAALILVSAVVAACHAILFKKNPRAAVGWLAVILFFPLVGAILYVTLGINHIQRRASSLRTRGARDRSLRNEYACSLKALSHLLPDDSTHLATLATLVNKVTGSPLLKANTIEPLVNGDAAYPAMVEAIRAAKVSVALSTYIFAHDDAGRLFVDALADAVKRGVEVRVLIDYAGSRYSFPSVGRWLHRAGVRTAYFMPTFKPVLTQYSNLRSHRKILVVDGTVGFTGGVNIRADNLVQRNPPAPVHDIHFKITGPVVRQLQEALVEDWRFTTREMLEGEKWFPEPAGTGNVLARGIADGPDEDYDKLREVILGAIACARRSIRIATPYFLPDTALIAALNVAALRGVSVEILIPRKNNLRVVGWAITAHLWQVLRHGCRVFLTPPPFEHTKIMVVDGAWSLVGSANWDPRSLRLNFEFNVEAYDAAFAGGLEAILDRKRSGAQETTLREVDSRRIPIRLRDGVARLFFPFL